MKRRMRSSTVFPLLLAGALAWPMIPSASAEPDRGDWSAQIALVDQALQRGDLPAAQAAWREAYVTAHASHGWPGMIAVGDAALRVSRQAGARDVFEPRARRAYLTALLRARRQGSLDGVLAAGEGFGRLGDRSVVQHALDIATDLAARTGDGEARQRVQAFRSHWVSRAPVS